MQVVRVGQRYLFLRIRLEEDSLEGLHREGSGGDIGSVYVVPVRDNKHLGVDYLPMTTTQSGSR